MTNPDDGGPAFPFAYEGHTTGPEVYYGMTLRDWFAGMVLNGKLSNPKHTRTVKKSGIKRRFAEYQAKRAYEIADAMIAERKKELP